MSASHFSDQRPLIEAMVVQSRMLTNLVNGSSVLLRFLERNVAHSKKGRRTGTA